MAESEGLIPDEYWGEEVSLEEKVALQKAANEAESILSIPFVEWTEMDNEYFEVLRENLGKTKDDVGPRKFKSYICKEQPFYLMVIPAGRQHNGEGMVAYYHTILEDMEFGECNGQYNLVSESELTEIFNINYNQ